MIKGTRRMLGIGLIIAGLVLLLYPKGIAMYHDRQQAALLEAQLEMMREIAVVDGGENPDGESQAVDGEKGTVESYPGDDSEQDGSEQIDSITDVAVIPEAEQETTAAPTTLSREERNKQIAGSWPVEAVLTIPKIDLKMPVISDATLGHLDVSPSSIIGTGTPWDGGNYAIAGHRSRTYGRHFNRLDELEIGDSVQITDVNGNQYAYTVYEKEVVDETDLSVLQNEGFDEVTLITCHPITEVHPTTRLIVKARLDTP